MPTVDQLRDRLDRQRREERAILEDRIRLFDTVWDDADFRSIACELLAYDLRN